MHIQVASSSSTTSSSASSSSSSRSSRRSARGRLLFTSPLRPTAVEITDPQWMNERLSESRLEGKGEILLIEPPVGFAYPPLSLLAPSPHSFLLLNDNKYTPCNYAVATPPLLVRGKTTRQKQQSANQNVALFRESADTETSMEVRYQHWQRRRIVQEKQQLTLQKQQIEERSGKEHGTKQQDEAMMEEEIKEETEGEEEGRHFESYKSKSPSASTVSAATSSCSLAIPADFASLPQARYPLFASLPLELQCIDDPLSIRAHIEAERARSVRMQISPSLSSPLMHDEKVSDDTPTSKKGSTSKKKVHSSSRSSSTKLSDCLHQTSNSSSSLDLPPLDPSGCDDGHIRYCKNSGAVAMMQVKLQQRRDDAAEMECQMSGEEETKAPPSVDDLHRPHDPLHHLRNTLIHSHHSYNLLNIAREDYEQRRYAQQQQQGASNESTDEASSTSSSAASTVTDYDDAELDTSGTGVLEPTLYCGVRGSLTSMHSENDQLSSFHQISAGIKVWYSIESTKENNRTLLSLMRRLQSITHEKKVEDRFDEDADTSSSEKLSFGLSDEDYGLKSHLWFFHPQTLLDLGLNVHVTVQTPVHSLVLTTGCYHQVLNLTTVEGWSCNFLPPCMIELVQRVREERMRGWQWNYAEGISLIALCWKSIMVGVDTSNLVLPQDDEQLLPTSIGVRIHLKADLESSVEGNSNYNNKDDSDTQKQRQQHPISYSGSIPQLLRRSCARVLCEVIKMELHDRALLLVDTTSTPSKHTSPRRSKLPDAKVKSRKHCRASTSEEDVLKSNDDDESKNVTSPFTFPLEVGDVPRSYPELCQFCQNLTFFSAVYCDTKPATSSSSSVSSMSSYHLSCTSCLVKYLQLRSQHSLLNNSHDDSAISQPQRKRQKGTKFGNRKNSQSTIGSVGRLPSDAEQQTKFMLLFARSLQRHARWWRAAYLGVRVSEVQLKYGILVTKDLLSEE